MCKRDEILRRWGDQGGDGWVETNREGILINDASRHEIFS